MNKRKQIYSSEKDPLTEVYTRRSFWYILQEEFRDFSDYPEKSKTLIVVGIDNIIQLNDMYGRNFGDQLLSEFARFLSENSRKSFDIIGRVRGSGFGIILIGYDVENAIAICERLLRFIGNREFGPEGQKVKLSASFGISSFRDNESAEMLEKQAERVNHIAEEEGGNRIYVSMDGAIFSSAEMERIIENKRLWIAIEAVRNGAEVMNSKTGEKLPLGLFVKMVDDAGVYNEAEFSIGDYVIKDRRSPSPALIAWAHELKPGIMNGITDTARQWLDIHGTKDVEEWEGLPKINFVGLRLTSYCSMRCVYCDQDRRVGTLPLETMLRALEEVTEGGERKGVFLSVSGGEPTHPKVLKTTLAVIEYARKKLGMYVSMNSNAVLITPAIAEKLLTAGLCQIHISLDSVDPIEESEMTRFPEALPRILEGLRAMEEARKKGFGDLKRIIINHVLTRNNYTSFADFIEHMVRRRKNGEVAFDVINPLPVKGIEPLFLRESDVITFRTKILPGVVEMTKKEGLTLTCAKSKEIFGPPGDDLRRFMASKGTYFSIEDRERYCFAALTSLYIGPDGFMTPCTYHREHIRDGGLVIGNVKNGEGIHTMREKHFRQLRMLPRQGDNVNDICLQNCGPDLKRINREVERFITHSKR